MVLVPAASYIFQQEWNPFLMLWLNLSVKWLSWSPFPEPVRNLVQCCNSNCWRSIEQVSNVFQPEFFQSLLVFRDVQSENSSGALPSLDGLYTTLWELKNCLALWELSLALFCHYVFCISCIKAIFKTKYDCFVFLKCINFIWFQNGRDA